MEKEEKLSAILAADRNDPLLQEWRAATEARALGRSADFHAPQAVIVSSFIEGHGFTHVEVHFRVGVDLLADRTPETLSDGSAGKIDPEKRQALERAVERAIRGIVIDLGKE